MVPVTSPPTDPGSLAPAPGHAGALRTGDRWFECGDPGGELLVAVLTWKAEPVHYQRLAPHLPGYRILSLTVPDPDKDVLPLRPEDWVDYHEGLLESLEPTGSLRLLGWSFSGVVAAELARRLVAKGREVSYVGMIDCHKPLLRPLSTRRYLWYHLREASLLPDESERLPYLLRKAIFLFQRRFPRSGDFVLRSLNRFGWARDIEASTSASEQKSADPLARAVRISYLNYDRDGIELPVCLYVTERSQRREPRPALNWASYLHAGYRVSRIEGNHFTLWSDEHVASLAAAVRLDLAHADLDAAASRDRTVLRGG